MAVGRLRPLVPASEIPRRFRPTVSVPEEKLYSLEELGTLRADGGRGTASNHQVGVLGEYALSQYLGIEDGVDTNLYEDGGDGGVDLEYGGVSIDVKTARQERSQPSLLVRERSSFQSDYYVLAHRIGPTDIRLIGYCPRKFVVNSKPWNFDGVKVREIPQQDLFPFPFEF